MMKTRYLGAVAIGALLAAGGSGTAHAVPSYAYATLQFTNFTLSGVVDASGNALPGVTNLTSSVLVSDASNYPSASAGGTSVFGTLSGGADPVQATSGPGAFPLENTFSQALTASSGTRGDAQITSPIATGATSNLVAEGNLTAFGSSAGSSAGSATTIKATFTASSALTVGLSFNAFATLFASVGAPGDSASVLTSADYTLQDKTTGAFLENNTSPAALNQGSAVTDPSAPFSSIGTSTFYSFSDTLTAGDSYQITLSDSVQDILGTAAPVPEPLSLAILGTGLAGLGLVRRYKKS